MIPLLVVLSGLVHSSSVDLEFAGKNEPARLRVVVPAVQGHSPEVAWATFLDKLFDHFDRDGNQTLSKVEAERIFALPLPDGREVKLNFATLDSNSDGMGTKEEFRTFYRQAGFTPVVAVVQPPKDDVVRLSAALFQQLDRDDNGTISVAEWKQAPVLLRRLDDNENEVLEATELLTTLDPRKEPATVTSIRVAVAEAKVAATLRVELGDKPDFRMESESSEIRFSPAQRLLDISGAKVRISLPSTKSGNSFRLASEFYLAQFSDAIGNKPSLTKDEMESNGGLEGLTAMFDAADCNGDGKLTTAELRSFLELVEAGVSCRIVVFIEDSGPNFFDLLDTNANGQLELAELVQAANRPALERAKVPLSVRLNILTEHVGKMFGPVPLPIRKTVSAKEAVRETAGPGWFRAMDRNGDGYVSAAEFRGPPELFAKLDRDGDGRISPSEAESTGK